MHSAIIQVLICSVAVLSAFTNAWAKDRGPEANVFAASSLRDAMVEVANAFEKKQGGKINFNFAGSNALAQQILSAPVADIFISANEEWMDKVEESKRTVPGTRRTLLMNSLVMITNKAAPFSIKSVTDLTKVEMKNLALANPEAVPAGKYAKAYLENSKMDGTSVWSKVSAHVAPAMDVRAALKLVEADPKVIGIVYKTDATTSQKVNIAYEIPNKEVPPINYAVAQIKASSENKNGEYSKKFSEFLQSDTSKQIFEKYGFLTPLKK